MKLLFLLCLLALPAETKKDLTWTTAVVESSSRQLYNNGSTPGSYSASAVQSVRESIYLDAGEWLYHVTQIVQPRGTLNLREGALIQVAEDGRHLVLRIDGKEHKLTIEQKSRGRKKP